MNKGHRVMDTIGRGLALALLAGCVSTVPDWNAASREETMKWFLENEYGVRPPAAENPDVSFSAIEPDAVMMDGAAVRKRVRITYRGPYGTNSFDVTAFVPKNAKTPSPAFLLICNRKPDENIDPTRRVKCDFWPAEEIVRRGYAAIAFYNGDIAPDWDTGNTQGVFACYEKPGPYRRRNLWGTLSAWAWGASRVMDWIETEPTLDAAHVAVVGHSRGGKTALLAGVTDPRFAMACSNDSGCSGAKLNRMDLPESEHLVNICPTFPYWFCKDYIKWVNRETEMPFDQHQWMALMAPRLVAVGSAEGDPWAGPAGEEASCELARPAWADPTCVDYHIRPGKHNLTLVDWTAYMDFADRKGWRTGALDGAVWISAKDAPVAGEKEKARKVQQSAPGTSWFVRSLENERKVVAATWTIASLGVFEATVNGQKVGDDYLAPGFTHARKTKYSFSYDVTGLLDADAGDANVFAVQVSAGWWRDQIVAYAGRKSALKSVIELTFADGTRKRYGTNTSDWKAGVGGPVLRAGIFDGEIYDARRPPLSECPEALDVPELNAEFAGEVLPTVGAEVTLREDLALAPVKAYAWKGVTGANGKDGPACVYGTVQVVRTFAADGEIDVLPGETVVVDFGQNAAAVPAFEFKAAEGTELAVLPGEMLNDGNGERSRGNDGPGGSLYRENLRIPQGGMALRYTFGAGDGFVSYHPHFTFFGFRYLSLTANGAVKVRRLRSLPVTSITQAMETGTLETGVKDLNRFIANVRWGQLSNYLSVPTDCPQRNERLGWTADTQVFCEAGAFNADTRRFFRKWMRDMRDSQHEKGGFPGVAPFAQYGNDAMRIGWADAGVIVPYLVWKQFGDVRIVKENWAAMEKFMARVAETKYRTDVMKDVAGECGNYQWADWLSFEKLESAGGAGKPQNSAFEPGPNGKGRRPKADAVLYWDFLGGSYWVWDAQMMATMARAVGKDAAKYEKMAAEAKAYMMERFFKTPDGRIIPVFRGMQTPALFALKLGFVSGAAKDATVAGLRQSIRDNGGCLQTGFLGTSVLMDTLTENGMADDAYSLLLNHGFPGWLYSVDQGATTVWERWNSYTKEKGFGPVGMNSFNHYAYGAVLAWLYRTVAGIAADPSAPGFRNIVMAPKPDRRLGSVKASYRSVAGLIRSAWHYEGDTWVWKFTIPPGATADVFVPGEAAPRRYSSGSHVIRTR